MVQALSPSFFLLVRERIRAQNAKRHEASRSMGRDRSSRPLISLPRPYAQLSGPSSVISDGKTPLNHLRAGGRPAPSASTRRRALRPAGPRAKPWSCGRAANERAPQAPSPDGTSPARSVIATATDASWRCAGLPAMTSMRGWSPKAGRSRTVNTRPTTFLQERAAKSARRGLWRGAFVPPWDWRRGKRLQGAVVTGTGECRIKGNIGRTGARIYHVPGGRSYDRTRIDTSKGERWFCTEAQAEAAGWRRARR